MPEIITELGGVPVRTRVGHSFIKGRMAETGAIFGGEHSGHFYFRDFWKADSGMLAALHVLAALGEQDGTLSELLAQYGRYAASGEINSEVADQAAKVAQIREVYGSRRGCRDRHARRPDRTVVPDVVVQRPRVQHRAAAAPQRRGGRPGRDGVAARRAARPDPQLTSSGAPMNLDPALLAILACPDCRSELRADDAAGELVCTGCGWPTRCATTSRCCWSTRPGGPPRTPPYSVSARWTRPCSTTSRRCEAADTGNMLLAAATSGAQVREAATASADAGLRPHRRRGPAPRCGRSSAPVRLRSPATCSLALAASGSPTPVLVVRGPDLPAWVGAADLAIAVSASGRATETLAATDEAIRRGVRLVTVSAEGSPLDLRGEQAGAPHVAVPGGRSARASLWAMAVPVLLAADALKLVSVPPDAIEATAEILVRFAERCRPSYESFLNPGQDVRGRAGRRRSR